MIDLLYHRFIDSPVHCLDSLIHDSLLIHWFTFSSQHFIQSLVRWFIDSPIHWFIGSLVGWFIGSLLRCFIGSLLNWFVDSLLHRFIGSLVPSLSCDGILSCHVIGMSTATSSFVLMCTSQLQLLIASAVQKHSYRPLTFSRFLFSKLPPGVCRALSGSL